MRLRRIFRGVDVEERIHRLGGSIGGGVAVAGGPELDLAQILINKGVPQILAQRDGPKADHRISEVSRPVV
jgi:hypothetical protein